MPADSLTQVGAGASADTEMTKFVSRALSYYCDMTLWQEF